MGISLNFLPYFIDEGKRSKLEGTVLQLGRQAVDITREELRKAAQHHTYALTPCTEQPLIPYQFGPDKLVLNDEEFFQSLGFSQVDALDFDTREGNNIVFDLNEPETPPSLIDKYDFIFNGGTLEHVFHQPNALANLHNMLKPQGRIMHISPASNHVEHGFYSFSPCFYIDYYAENGYDLIHLSLFKADFGQSPSPAWDLPLMPDQPALLDYLMTLGCLDDHVYMNIVIAQKKQGSTGTKVPMQGYYQSKARTASKPANSTPVYDNGKWLFKWNKLVPFQD